MTKHERLGVRRIGHVLIIEMNREQKRNSIDRLMAYAIDEALNQLEDQDDLWVGILAGSKRVFSAGSDMKALGDYKTERGGEYGIIRRKRRKPLIAAVEGPAFGGGLEIALSCDLVVASRTAQFGLPEVTRGLIPTCAALFRAPKVFPVNLARELILTGQPIDASRGFDCGFVNVLCEPGETIPQAVRLADQICENAPLSVQACLEAVNSLLGADDDRGWAATSNALNLISESTDLQEGIAAFFEKRKPTWTGR